MTALIQRFRKEEKGLTLIELLAVIVIIGIIAAIAVPLITGVLNKTKDNARVATANQLFEAAKLRSIAKNEGILSGTHSLDNLIKEEYIQDGLTDPRTGQSFDATGTIVNLEKLNTDDYIVILSIGGKIEGQYKLSELTKNSETAKDTP